ncbi:MAG: membrane protein insertase YidC [Candidatus Omnitrophica bacterium]|nr:membrane protein insertase YidC [Candidatus Omnitrophota bacterium]
MEKRLLIATVLSLAILLFFNNNIIKKPVQETQEMPQQIISESTQQAIEKEQAPVSTQKSELSVFQGEETFFEAEKYKVVFSNVGASIKEILVITNGQVEELTKASIQNEAIFGIEGIKYGTIDTSIYSVEKQGNYILFTTKTPEGLKIEKKYVFDERKNQVVLNLRISNTTENIINLKYDIVGPAEMKEIGFIKGRSFLEAAISLTDDSLIRKTKVKGDFKVTEPVNFAAISNRYYSVIVKPFDAEKGITLTGDGKEGQKIVFNGFEAGLAPSESVSNELFMYFGPTVDNELKEYGYGFEKVVNYGIFSPISIGLVKMLRFFHKVTNNWGVAILLLTFVVNVISFPLTKKSFTSLNKMKTLQPHMEKLKKLHKDNPQKLNKEMMELYKKYNVNPFGGCLPMLLQIPIFIALYQGLIKAVELKGASFLWIKDLSGPEAVHIPMTLPFIGNSINVLPLLMVVMMFFQQKIQGAQQVGATSDEQAQQQKMMMTIMPVFFGFLFYSMPSGLVLYWLTNTTLMTLEQIYLKKTAN